MTADQIIQALGLQPHPEGGWFRETYRDRPASGERGALTVIYYLLKAGERSAWHRVDATEVWHYYAGAPLRLSLAQQPGALSILELGTDFAAGQVAHGVVPKQVWQSAESLGDWTLVGCTVAPAFEFTGFELASATFSPNTP
ncbi:MAG: cupin domain-containing protein [Hyphomicrobiales bacterium]|nr:cupin domain-containing protein [Hyphomicrobiales bacterium]